MLRCLDGVPDAWFNRALAAAAAGQPGRALEWMAACCAARPTDAAALRALARLWARLGHWHEAQDALRRASAIDPNAPELDRIRAALRSLRAQSLRSKPGPGRQFGCRRKTRPGRRAKLAWLW